MSNGRRIQAVTRARIRHARQRIGEQCAQEGCTSWGTTEIERTDGMFYFGCDEHAEAALDETAPEEIVSVTSLSGGFTTTALDTWLDYHRQDGS